MNNSNNTPSQQQPPQQQQQGLQLHQLPLDKEDKYYSIIEEENKTKLKLILEQEKDRLKALMPNIYMPSSTSTSSSSSSSSASNNTNGTSNKSEANAELANVAGKQQQFVSSSVPLPPQPIALNSTSINNYHLNDANKAFDDVVFDILKVDPDYIAVGFEYFFFVFILLFIKFKCLNGFIEVINFDWV